MKKKISLALVILLLTATFATAQEPGQQGWQHSTWRINTVLPAGDIVEFLDGSCGNMLACDADVAAPTIWRTANGVAWAAAVTSPTARPYSLVEASDGFIYAGCLDEIWRSGDCGVNWVQRNSAIGVNANNTICEHTDGYLYIATGSLTDRVMRSGDGGTTWATVFQGPPTPQAIISASDGYLYIAAEHFDGAFVLRSQNGTTWIQVYDIGRNSEAAAMIRELDDGFIYAGTMNSVVAGETGAYLHRSANGTDWTQIAFFAYTFYPDAIVYTSAGVYYLLLTNGRLYSSSNIFDWTFVMDIGGAIGTNVDLIEYSGNDGVYAGEAGDIWWSLSDLLRRLPIGPEPLRSVPGPGAAGPVKPPD